MPSSTTSSPPTGRASSGQPANPYRKGDALDPYRQIAPGKTERGFAVGHTGCGKTTLGKRLMRCHYWVLAIDPKITLGTSAGNPTGHLPGFALARSPEELVELSRRHPWLQYRPDPDYQEPEDYEAIYKWAFDAKNRFLYTDEVLLVSHRREVPDAMRACLTSGRERGIGMLNGTQRPSMIDGRLVSESEHFYCFALNKKADRERMAEMMDERVLSQPAQGHEFWYQGPASRAAQLLQIEGVS